MRGGLKKLKKSFSQEQIDKLKTLSKKMAKLVDFNQKEDNINSRPSNQNFSRGTGGQFNRGGNISRAEMLSRIRNRTGSSAGAGNFSRGNRNSLQHLKDMGYETFGDFIDESYDTMADRERLEKVVDNIKQIDKIENKLAWYKDMKPILEHNYWTLKRNSRDLAPQAYITIQNAWKEYFNV